MRILVLGAGGVGGYFGGRLAEQGKQVDFLVRRGRKQQLERSGLSVKSLHGDFVITPSLITADSRVKPYDLILFSTKSYHLAAAIRDLKPFVGRQTLIVPLLNGMSHMDILKREYGEEKVLGGLCFIESTLNESGEVVQTSPVNRVVFGALHPEQEERCRQLQEYLNDEKNRFILSDHVEQEMWHKYLFITVLAGLTTLMRAPVGAIRESGFGSSLFQQLLSETAEIVKAVNAPISEDIVETTVNSIHALPYGMKSSMQRDMEKNQEIEARHIHGYLLTMAESNGIEAPLLRIIYENLLVYERLNARS
ncbi:ketopantoate reductase family protein [Peribacillus kribbensis]|uniref:ketopantoate reductase family protein n=1 Tax=Peribacillus kribbensis TaxID=356658 RepID=UPI0003FA542F|nr:ketopantoate reductase family protein [Peribacillus kribbensis]